MRIERTVIGCYNVIEKESMSYGWRYIMTAIRQEAMQLLEQMPEDKLKYVIQILQGVNGLLEETEKKLDINLDQFIMPATERGQDADKYIMISKSGKAFSNLSYPA